MQCSSSFHLEGNISKRSNQIDKIVCWCRDNVGPIEYDLDQLSGKKVGGTGWEVNFSGFGITTFIEDPSLHAFFMLSFVK